MADPLKIAILGAGSIPFATGVFQDALLIHKLNGIELALADADEAVLYAMTDVGRRVVQKSGLDARVTAHPDRAAAIEGAAYVLSAAHDGRPERFAADARIIRGLVPNERISPHAGIAGISYSLRQIRLVQDICDEIKRLAAPEAMLLNVADPVAQICQAAHDDGVT